MSFLVHSRFMSTTQTPLSIRVHREATIVSGAEERESSENPFVSETSEESGLEKVASRSVLEDSERHLFMFILGDTSAATVVHVQSTENRDHSMSNVWSSDSRDVHRPLSPIYSNVSLPSVNPSFSTQSPLPASLSRCPKVLTYPFYSIPAGCPLHVK